MGTIPKRLQPHIDEALPTGHVCLVGSVLPNGYAQISPRGSAQVFDDNTISLWERGRGTTTDNTHDGSKFTIYYMNRDLREQGMMIVRLYGTAEVHTSGPAYEKVWERLIEGERRGDPDKKGHAVLIRIERTENLRGEPISETPPG